MTPRPAPVLSAQQARQAAQLLGATSCCAAKQHQRNWIGLQVDIVWSETLINDGFEDKIKGNSRVQVMERLMRKTLALPRKPAMVLMQVGGAGRRRLADRGPPGWRRRVVDQAGGLRWLPAGPGSVTAAACQ
jgi:hypothetical protein